MTTNNDTITLDSTVDLDDSSVMSSTKNSSVLEVTNNVVDISTDTSSSETDKQMVAEKGVDQTVPVYRKQGHGASERGLPDWPEAGSSCP